MEISQLTLKLIILLIPGGVAAIIIERLTVHKPWDAFRFVTTCILMGVLSYLLLQAGAWLLNIVGRIFSHPHWLAYPTVWSNLTKEGAIPFTDVVEGCCMAIPAGLLVSMGDNKKWLIRLANSIGASDKYGDESLYYNFMRDNDTTWVYVRNVGADGVTYTGEVVSYEDAKDAVELVLLNVKVYQSDSSEELYAADKVYLSLPKDKVIIEYADTKPPPTPPKPEKP